MKCAINIICCILAVCSTWSSANCAYGDTIKLQSSARISDVYTKITLKQVAELNGDYAESLGDIIIADYPNNKGKIIVSISDIRYALNNGGIDKPVDENHPVNRINWAKLAISGSQCSVTQFTTDTDKQTEIEISDNETREDKPTNIIQVWASEVCDNNNIMAVIADFMAARLTEGNKENVYLTFDIADTDILTTTLDNREVEVIPQATKNSARVPLVINLYSGDNIDITYKLSVRIEISKSVVIVNRYMVRGECFKQDDLTEEVRLIDPYYNDPVGSINDVLGKETRGRLVKGQLLRNQDIKVPVMIKNRAQVVLRSRVGSFVVRMNVIAQESGEVGQIIRVKHIGSNVELQALVEADGELVVINDSNIKEDNYKQ